MRTEKDWLNQVILEFYEQAKTDFLIGYHFRHIKDFDEHIPKIQRFWQLILLPLSSDEKKNIIQQGVPKNIIHSHEYLKIKKGEVGRWMTLFKQTLQKIETNENRDFFEKWREELLKFEKIFLNADSLFSNS